MKTKDSLGFALPLGEITLCAAGLAFVLILGT